MKKYLAALLTALLLLCMALSAGAVGPALTATEAYEKGLLTRVVAAEELAAEVSASVERICQGAPLVAGWHKQWIKRLQSGTPLSEEEKAASFAFLATEDYREGLAAFLEKRKPQF